MQATRQIVDNPAVTNLKSNDPPDSAALRVLDLRSLTCAPWLAAFVSGASAIIATTLPLLMGLFAGRLQLDWRQVGWLVATGQVGTLAGTLIAQRLIVRNELLLGLRVGAASALCFSVLVALSTNYEWLLSWRVLTSVGVGVVITIGIYIIGRSILPTAGYSIMAGIQVICGSVHAALLPLLHTRFGYVAAIGSVGIWFLVILLLIWRVAPGHMLANAPQEYSIGRPGAGRSASALPVLFSLMLFQAAVMTIWVYSERIAVIHGLSEGDIGMAIAIGNFGGLPGAVLGALIGDRSRYAPMLWLATLSVAAGELMMLYGASFSTYGIGQFLFNFGWILGVSYYMGLLAKRDTAGRFLRFASPALVIASGLGPACVALFSRLESPAFLVALSLASCAAALLLAFSAQDRDRLATPDAEKRSL
jgi:predicted MFS family arabinose efflux permease